MKEFRLLLIGSNNIWSIERYYLKYLKELGIDTHLFEAQNKFSAYYSSSILNKIIFRLGISGFYKKMNRELMDYVDQLRPDVIWVFKGMEVLPEALQYFKEKNIFLVNYNPDNPFIFSGRGSGNPNVTNSLSLYNLHLTYNLEVQAQFINKLKIPAEILPFGFDVSTETFEKCEREPEIIKTCFLGNPDKERAAFIQELASSVPVDVYGTGWGKFITHKNVTLYPPLYGDDGWQVLRKYRVQLNLMRIHNLDSHNMRTFEIPGIGGIMLAPATKEHLSYFKNGVEAFFFQNAQDCIEKIKYITNLSQQNSSNIRSQARNVSLLKGYDYKSRTHLALNHINKYLTLGNEIK